MIKPSTRNHMGNVPMLVTDNRCHDSGIRKIEKRVEMVSIKRTELIPYC